MEEYFELNRKAWNDRTEKHVKSAFYDMEGFAKGGSSLDEISVNLLGDLKGKRVLHLQCHFGQDTLSLARMGAEVTGVDLSDNAIEKAKDFAKELNIKAEFIRCNVLDIDKHLTGEFDVIFTSYGVVGWLPELMRWGRLIHQFLKPGGKFILIEFHPFVWMYDDKLEEITYGYFNTGAFVEEEEGTYADKEDKTVRKEAYWNHGLSEVFQALAGSGLRVSDFQEYDYSFYEVLPRPVRVEKGFQVGGLEGKLPLTYSMVARKEG